MTFKEFSGKNVEEAIRAAMKEFGADLGDLDIEILAQGSRGILGVGSDEARILAAPKSAVAEASSLRTDAPAAPSRAPAPPADAPAATDEPDADAVADAGTLDPEPAVFDESDTGLTPVMADEAPAPPHLDAAAAAARNPGRDAVAPTAAPVPIVHRVNRDRASRATATAPSPAPSCRPSRSRSSPSPSARRSMRPRPCSRRCSA